MGSSRPSLKYNSINKRWEVKGKGGQTIASFGDDGTATTITAETTSLEVGATGDAFTKMYKFVATLTAAVAIGSGAIGIGTLASLTGSGVGCSELAINDFVMGVPKVNLATVGIAGFRVPTTNTLNIYLHTLGEDAGGSLAACGFDIVAFR